MSFVVISKVSNVFLSRFLTMLFERTHCPSFQFSPTHETFENGVVHVMAALHLCIPYRTRPIQNQIRLTDAVKRNKAFFRWDRATPEGYI